LRLGMPIVVEGAPYVGAQLWTVGVEGGGGLWRKEIETA
jgi:hypothetical protein